MPELICDLHLTVKRIEDGIEASGPVKFEGNGKDMILTMASLLSMLRWPKNLLGLSMFADAFEQYKEQCPDWEGSDDECRN